MQFSYRPQGVCSRQINLVLEDGIVQEAEIVGGCNGNSKGIAALVKGRDAREVIEQLRGIHCDRRGTSCPDQLAQALTQALEQEA